MLNLFDKIISCSLRKSHLSLDRADIPKMQEKARGPLTINTFMLTRVFENFGNKILQKKAQSMQQPESCLNALEVESSVGSLWVLK